MSNSIAGELHAEVVRAHFEMIQMIFENHIRQYAAFAADLIEESGWWSEGRKVGGSGRGPNGERCLAMAVVDASGCSTLGAMENLFGRIESIIVAETRFKIQETKDKKRLAARWNDAPGRTSEEVVSLLRRVQAGHKPEEASK